MEEGSSSNRPELTALLLALRDTRIEERLLYLCDNQSLLNDLTCKRGSVGQSKGLSILRSSIRFRLKPENSNSHGFGLYRPSNKGTELLLKVIKVIIVIKAVNRWIGAGGKATLVGASNGCAICQNCMFSGEFNTLFFCRRL